MLRLRRILVGVAWSGALNAFCVLEGRGNAMVWPEQLALDAPGCEKQHGAGGEVNVLTF